MFTGSQELKKEISDSLRQVRKRGLMYKLCGVAVLVLFAACSSSGQDFQKFDISGGYSFATVPDPAPPGHGNGWNLTFQFNPIRFLGIKADFGGDYAGRHRSGELPELFHQQTFTFGPVAEIRSRLRFTPFAEWLFGEYHYSLPGLALSYPDNGFAMIAGGGVDFRLAPHASVRAGQVDWVYTNYPTFFNWPKNHIRVSAGFVVSF